MWLLLLLLFAVCCKNQEHLQCYFMNFCVRTRCACVKAFSPHRIVCDSHLVLIGIYILFGQLRMPNCRSATQSQPSNRQRKKYDSKIENLRIIPNHRFHICAR